MNKQTLVFQTNCSDAKSAKSFESRAKSIYHDGDDKPTLTFLHNEPPHVVAQTVKKKRATHVIAEGVSTTDFRNTVKSVKKTMNGNSPKFIQIGVTQEIEDVSVYLKHEDAREAISN